MKKFSPTFFIFLLIFFALIYVFMLFQLQPRVDTDDVKCIVLSKNGKIIYINNYEKIIPVVNEVLENVDGVVRLALTKERVAEIKKRSDWLEIYLNPTYVTVNKGYTGPGKDILKAEKIFIVLRGYNAGLVAVYGSNIWNVYMINTDKDAFRKLISIFYQLNHTIKSADQNILPRSSR